MSNVLFRKSRSDTYANLYSRSCFDSNNRLNKIKYNGSYRLTSFKDVLKWERNSISDYLFGLALSRPKTNQRFIYNSERSLKRISQYVYRTTLNMKSKTKILPNLSFISSIKKIQQRVKDYR